MENTDRQRVTIATKNDFDVSYYCGPGPGGQARNKSATGVQIIHKESGASGRAHDSRSQSQNKENAFKRLIESPKFKFWLAQRLYEIDKHETIEQTVEREMKPENLRYEIKDATGKWEEVNDAYFDGAAAKEESR